MDNHSTPDPKLRDAAPNTAPDLGELDKFLGKIVKVPKKELDDLLAHEPKRPPRQKRA